MIRSAERWWPAGTSVEKNSTVNQFQGEVILLKCIGLFDYCYGVDVVVDDDDDDDDDDVPSMLTSTFA